MRTAKILTWIVLLAALGLLATTRFAVPALWVFLALWGLFNVERILDHFHGWGVYASTRLTALILWYLALLWPLFRPDFRKIHWVWVLPLSYLVPLLVRGVMWRLALRSGGFLPEVHPGTGQTRLPQFWWVTVAGSVVVFVVLLEKLSR